MERIFRSARRFVLVSAVAQRVPSVMRRFNEKSRGLGFTKAPPSKSTHQGSMTSNLSEST
jgi:hypothetical protein